MRNRPSFRFIYYCVDNKVFAHTLLLIVTVLGLVGLFNIQTQLIPNLTIPQVFTTFIWPGASAEQIESNITEPAEQNVDGITGLDTMISVSRLGSATMVLSFFQDQDINTARQEVVQAYDSTRFPDDIEDWQTQIVEPKEQVARLLIQDVSNENLKQAIRNIQTELKGQGIHSTATTGEINLELVLEVAPQWLLNQQVDLKTLTRATQSMLVELPSGFLGEAGQYSSSEIGTPFDNIQKLDWSLNIGNPPITHHASTVFNNAYLRPSEKDSRLFVNNQPAAEIRVFRATNQDLLTVASNLENWFKQYDNPNLTLSVYDETWSYFYDRLFLLGKNGVFGLILIAILLSYFLNKKTAFWVGMGIPISLLGTVAVMYALGFQINMISLFAMILSLGIIVDDAIVVGERHTSLSQYMSSAKAAKDAACEMVRPILTSSMTTLAAFFPLLFISGVMGQFLKEIPVVVITVIVASLIECFYILPKHLSSFEIKDDKQSKYQVRFRHFRIHHFLPLIRMAIKQRAIIFSAAISFILITYALLATGHIKFSFFPSYTSDRITIEVDFAPKATFAQKQSFLSELEAFTTNKINNLDAFVLKQAYVVMNKRLGERYSPNPINNGIQVWLTAQDNREISNEAIISALNNATPKSDIVRQIIIDQPRGGPPSDTIQIELIGQDDQLEKAVVDLKAALNDFNGVTNIKDDISTLIPNHYFQLDGTMLFSGMDHHNLYNQVQSYLQDSKQFTLSHNGEEIDITIKVPDANLALKDDLLTLPILLPNESYLPLGEIADLSVIEKPQQLIRKNRNRTATVSARVDSQVTNTYEIEHTVQNNIIPKLEEKYAIITMAGKIKQDQLKTISELKSGALIGICAIFLILTWSANSFKIPFAILLTVPLSLMGGVLGHGILGFDITLLSLFGFFGLMGVTVNDSIILVLRYQTLLKSISKEAALIQASGDRFRAVILTSLTTIGGLLPLLFETSFQAQFLIPMAITIAFGLLFGTLWILLFLPAILTLVG